MRHARVISSVPVKYSLLQSTTHCFLLQETAKTFTFNLYDITVDFNYYSCCECHLRTMGDTTQWHLRSQQPRNPIVFFGEKKDVRKLYIFMFCRSLLH